MDIHWDLVIAWVVNFLVLVFLFRKFLGDQIVQQIEKRNELMEKLKKADDEYKKMIEFAHKESGLILEKAEKRRKELIHEAHLIAEEEKDKILKAAEHKAELIVEDSKLAMHRIETQLKEDWVQSVKETSKKVVKRLLKHNQELGDEYFAVLVEDVQK